MGGIKGGNMELFNIPLHKDVVYTPEFLSESIVRYFMPSGRCLDPCRGDGAFFKFLPDGSDWCEISNDRDFWGYSKKVDWIVGNPPYSMLLEWIRHSFSISDNVLYLMPLHRVFASYGFIKDIERYGGIREIVTLGTGHHYGFPFGHCLGVVHYKKKYSGDTKWVSKEEFENSTKPD